MLPPQFYFGNATAFLLWLFQTVPHELLVGAFAVTAVFCAFLLASIMVLVIYVALRCVTHLTIVGKQRLKGSFGRDPDDSDIDPLELEDRERRQRKLPRVISLTREVITRPPRVEEPLQTPPGVRMGGIPTMPVYPTDPQFTALHVPPTRQPLSDLTRRALPSNVLRRSNRLLDRTTSD